MQQSPSLTVPASGGFEASLCHNSFSADMVSQLHGGWRQQPPRPNFGLPGTRDGAGEPMRVFLVGNRAGITFPLPYKPRHARFRITIAEVLHPATITVSANGWRLTSTALNKGKTYNGRLDYQIPGEAMQQDTLMLQFDADRSAPAVGPEAFLCELVSCRLDLGPPAGSVDFAEDPASLLGRFESLGDNCEFGFVQRYFGVNRIGMFTFAGVRHPGHLLDMLERDFEGLGEPGSLTGDEIVWMRKRDPAPPDPVREFYLTDQRFGYSFHTFKGTPEHTRAEVVAENELRLRFLRRKIIEDLEDATKIWVFKDTETPDLNQVLSLHSALCRHAPNQLFWVTRTVPGREGGSVEWMAPGLLRGYSANPHGDAQHFDPESWLLLCRRAAAAFEGAQRTAAPTGPDARHRS